MNKELLNEIAAIIAANEGVHVVQRHRDAASSILAAVEYNNLAPPSGEGVGSGLEAVAWRKPTPYGVGYNFASEEIMRDMADWLAPTPQSAPVDGDRREFLGKLVRMEWVAWAREQPNAKPSWLLPWEQLTEPEREVDRRIGERIYQVAVIDAATPPPASQEET